MVAKLNKLATEIWLRTRNNEVPQSYEECLKEALAFLNKSEVKDE